MISLKKVATVMAVVIMALGLGACNEQVPPGHLGKIVGKTGIQPEIYPPSTVWLSTFLETVPEKLLLVEATTQKYNQPIKVLLKDKLTLNAEIVFRGRIRTTDKTLVNTIFNDIPIGDGLITVSEVYNTYGKMIVLNTARGVISKYGVDEVNKNYDRITVELYTAIAAKLEGLPMEISDVTIGAIKYPTIVTRAIESAKKRQMTIQKEQAEVQILLTRSKGQEELAAAGYRIKMMEAKRIRDFNKMTAQGITPDLLTLRRLELRQIELEKWNGVLPTTYMGSGDVPVIVQAR